MPIVCFTEVLKFWMDQKIASLRLVHFSKSNLTKAHWISVCCIVPLNVFIHRAGWMNTLISRCGMIVNIPFVEHTFRSTVTRSLTLGQVMPDWASCIVEYCVNFNPGWPCPKGECIIFWLNPKFADSAVFIFQLYNSSCYIDALCEVTRRKTR